MESTVLPLHPPIDRDFAGSVAERMQMLASPARVQILSHLKQGTSSLSELTEAGRD